MAKPTEPTKQAARLLGKRSAEARRKAWGKAEFLRRMRDWGKRGGRPRKPKSGMRRQESTKGKGSGKKGKQRGDE